MTSCAIDPQYSLKHPVNIPKTWHARDKHITYKSTDNLICMPWWRQYHDAMLNQLIAQGLQHNNDIHVAMANVEAAQGELKRVELNWIPTLGGNVGYSSFPYLGYPGVLVTAVPTYTLNIFGQIKEQQRAHYEIKITKAMRDSVKLTVIAQIAGSYFSYLAQVEQLQLLKKIDNDLTESVLINQALYKGGLYSDINLVNAKKDLNLIKAEENVVKHNLVLSQNSIQYLIDKNPDSLHITRKFRQVDNHQLVIGSLPLNIIEHRPDMTESINELKASNAGVGLAISNFLPTIQLSAARGDIATVPNGTTLGTPIYFNQALLQQPMITLTSLGQLDKFRALNKAAYYRYVNTVRKVLRDVDNHLSAHEYYSQRLDNTIDAQHNIERNYQLHDDLYRQGIISYLSLLEEKIKRDKINILVNKHKLEQTITVVNLYQALAVGYGCS